MPGQFPDRKTAGVPPDITKARHEVEQMMIQAANSAAESSAASASAAQSATHAAEHAEESQTHAAESRDWAERQSQGVHFAPDEPEYDKKFDGQLWLKTDEAAREIVKVRRWDASLDGQGLFPSESLYPSGDLYPQDKGAWTDFTFNLS